MSPSHFSRCCGSWSYTWRLCGATSPVAMGGCVVPGSRRPIPSPDFGTYVLSVVWIHRLRPYVPVPAQPAESAASLLCIHDCLSSTLRIRHHQRPPFRGEHPHFLSHLCYRFLGFPRRSSLISSRQVFTPPLVLSEAALSQISGWEAVGSSTCSESSLGASASISSHCLCLFSWVVRAAGLHQCLTRHIHSLRNLPRMPG